MSNLAEDRLEARIGVEPTNKGFADLPPSTATLFFATAERKDPTFDPNLIQRQPAKCQAKSSPCARLDLIPRESLERLAGRLELGSQRYGKSNWRKGLTDQEYVLERLAHTIRHCYTLIDKIEGRLAWDGDDDAAAIMWGGMFATCSPLADPAGPQGADHA